MSESRLDAERVAAALEVMIVKADRADPFGLAVDAAEVGRRQLERHFGNLGTSPHKELCRIRTELAAGELASKGGARNRLDWVARRLGYPDERRLREAVGQAFGVSPRELRSGAKIQRALLKDEELRRKARGKQISSGLWSAYRRRRNREKLHSLLGKANPLGSNVILGHAVFPRPCEARKIALELAWPRVRRLKIATDLSAKKAA